MKNVTLVFCLTLFSISLSGAVGCAKKSSSVVAGAAASSDAAAAAATSVTLPRVGM